MLICTLGTVVCPPCIIQGCCEDQVDIMLLSKRQHTCQCTLVVPVLDSPCPQNGEGNGNPLQYSCLENHMDRRAWWATIHGVAKSWTRLSDFCVCVCVCLQKRTQGGVTNSRSTCTEVYYFLSRVLSHSFFHSGRTVSVGHQKRLLIQLIPEKKVSQISSVLWRSNN